MTTGGWIVMLLSVGSVTALFAWCLVKVTLPPDRTETLHGLDFHPPDEKRDA